VRLYIYATAPNNNIQKQKTLVSTLPLVWVRPEPASLHFPLDIHHLWQQNTKKNNVPVSFVSNYTHPRFHQICVFSFFSYWCLVGNFGNDPLANYQFHNPSNPQQPIHSLSFCSENPWISACLTHHNGRLHLAVMAAFQDKT